MLKSQVNFDVFGCRTGVRRVLIWLGLFWEMGALARGWVRRDLYDVAGMVGIPKNSQHMNVRLGAVEELGIRN